MSYCVQCGVELDASLTQCPLCKTKVYNPNLLSSQPVPSPYPPSDSKQMESLTKKSFLTLITLAFIFPAAICVLVDLLVNHRFSWSLFALGALLVAWINLLVPIVVKKFKTYMSIITVTITLSAYLWVIDRLTQGNGWFGHIAFPLIVLLSLATMIITASIRHRLIRQLEIPALVFSFLALFILIVELLISSFSNSSLKIFWSPLVAAPCMLIALILFYLQKSPSLKLALQKFFHF